MPTNTDPAICDLPSRSQVDAARLSADLWRRFLTAQL
jgi:hypothetical protein